MNRPELLDKAKELITSDRQNTYGTPEDNFSTIAEYWTTYLRKELVVDLSGSIKLNAKHVAIMMALLKIARMHSSPEHVDNYIDLIGYAACGGEICTKQHINK